jgi:hypothetical protein
MTGNAFEDTLVDFRRWAGTTGPKLSGDREADAAELGMLFGLMPDYLGVESPSELVAGHLTPLLLDLYPRKVTVLDGEDTAGTIPALRDLTAYLADTGAITAESAQAMQRELDEIEPRFAGAVMDPANWGSARATVQAMYRDGVDLNDHDAVDRWIAQQKPAPPTGHHAGPLTWEGTDLRRAFAVPDVLAPARTPDQATLTALAGTAPLLADLRGLVRDVHAATVRIADLEPFLAGLALGSGLVRHDGDTLLPGDDADWLDDLSADGAVLEFWLSTFAQALDAPLDTAQGTRSYADEDLDLTGHGIALVTDLYLAGRPGVPVAELASSLKSAAVAGLPPDVAERRWEEWTGAHGDPARMLLGRLARLSAATVSSEVARLEPLGLFAVGAKLRACGVHIPELPPSGAMSANDVVLVGMLGTEEDLEAELAAWLAGRTHEEAARELLTFAAGEPPAVRTEAIAVMSRLGAAAESAWREALARPELRCYAKPALLAQLAVRNPGSAVPAELKITTEDVAWYVADTFAPLTHLDHGSGTFPFDMSQLADAGWTASNEAIFDAMARLGHPDAEPVLSMLGSHADNKQTAKAARRAAHKAASRGRVTPE